MNGHQCQNKLGRFRKHQLKEPKRNSSSLRLSITGILEFWRHTVTPRGGGFGIFENLRFLSYIFTFPKINEGLSITTRFAQITLVNVTIVIDCTLFTLLKYELQV